MSAGIPNSLLLDLLQTTIENLPDDEFEVALKYQNYEVCNRWFAKDKVQSDGGTSISRRISVGDTGAAEHVLPFEKKAVNVVDTMKPITAPWVHLRTHYSIERKEMLQNRSRAKLINLVKTRRLGGKLSAADLLERHAWEAPNSANDQRHSRGVPYYIRKANAGVTTGGFVGQTVRYLNGSTSTDLGGLDLSTTENALVRTYADVYTEFNADLIRRMRMLYLKTRFDGPVTIADMLKRPFSDMRIYMGADEVIAYEDMATAANDNIGSDLHPFGGSTTFKRTPIKHIPVLDSDAHDPIYFIHHGHFYPLVLSGEWMRENDPMNDVEQHNTFTTFYDSSYQFFLDNPQQAGGVLHKVTSS